MTIKTRLTQIERTHRAAAGLILIVDTTAPDWEDKLAAIETAKTAANISNPIIIIDQMEDTTDDHSH